MSSETEKTLDSRDMLIIAAERLFAEHGLDAVSTRQIARAAGQANTAAVHYWFGSREMLVEAILERRMSAINRQRLDMINDFLRSKRQPDLREIVSLYVRPLTAQLAGGTPYVRFTAQVYASLEIDIGTLAAGKWDQSLRAVARMVRDRLPTLPRPILRTRVAFLFHQVVYALADWERERLTDRPGIPELPLEDYVSNLIEMMACALAAPAPAKSTE
jgi:AcrR family transcriptional regulator